MSKIQLNNEEEEALKKGLESYTKSMDYKISKELIKKNITSIKSETIKSKRWSGVKHNNRDYQFFIFEKGDYEVFFNIDKTFIFNLKKDDYLIKDFEEDYKVEIYPNIKGLINELKKQNKNIESLPIIKWLKDLPKGEINLLWLLELVTTAAKLSMIYNPKLMQKLVINPLRNKFNWKEDRIKELKEKLDRYFKQLSEKKNKDKLIGVCTKGGNLIRKCLSHLHIQDILFFKARVTTPLRHDTTIIITKEGKWLLINSLSPLNKRNVLKESDLKIYKKLFYEQSLKK